MKTLFSDPGYDDLGDDGADAYLAVFVDPRGRAHTALVGEKRRPPRFASTAVMPSAAAMPAGLASCDAGTAGLLDRCLTGTVH